MPSYKPQLGGGGGRPVPKPPTPPKPPSPGAATRSLGSPGMAPQRQQAPPMPGGGGAQQQLQALEGMGLPPGWTPINYADAYQQFPDQRGALESTFAQAMERQLGITPSWFRR